MSFPLENEPRIKEIQWAAVGRLYTEDEAAELETLGATAEFVNLVICPDCDGDGVTGNSPDSPPCGTCQPEERRAESDGWNGNPSTVPRSYISRRSEMTAGERREQNRVLDRRGASFGAYEAARERQREDDFLICQCGCGCLDTLPPLSGAGERCPSCDDRCLP